MPRGERPLFELAALFSNFISSVKTQFYGMDFKTGNVKMRKFSRTFRKLRATNFAWKQKLVSEVEPGFWADLIKKTPTKRKFKLLFLKSFQNLSKVKNLKSFFKT